MDLEERVAVLERRLEDVDSGRRANALRLRNHRAVFILSAFLATVFGLEVEKIGLSKDGQFEVSLREIRLEVIVAGLVAASLVADEDAGKILDRFLRK